MPSILKFHPGLTGVLSAADKRETAYNILAENPTQVTSDDGVDLLAPRIGMFKGLRRNLCIKANMK